MPRAKPLPTVDAVVIGRNEGARLVACLGALRGVIDRVVYVDSGSTDASPEVARAAGAQVVALDPDRPFTAARARNAGLRALSCDPPRHVQFIDGDCILRPDWPGLAMRALDDTLARARHYGQRAIDALGPFPAGKAKDAMVEAVEFAVARAY